MEKEHKYSVFVHDQKFHTYAIYYSDGEYIEDSDDAPSKDYDSFEHSKLTKEKIQESLAEGISLKYVLKKYSKKIGKWRYEILNCETLIKKFDFFRTFIKEDGCRFQNTNESNIMGFFRSYSSKIYKAYDWDPVTWDEYLFYEQTYNGATMYCEPGEYDCLGYDFKMSYPTILASQTIVNETTRDFYFAVKKSSPTKLKALPKRLELGLYRVNIKCDDTQFLKIFNLKYDTNMYTHTDIMFCRKHKKRFNIKMKLVIDDEPNALIYSNLNKVGDQRMTLNGKHIFKPWYDRLKDLKEELPNNGLIKLMSSSIWGYLSKINKRYYSEDEILEKEIKCDYDDDEDIDYLCLREKDDKEGGTDYMLINKEQPYSKNYRLKPFITSFQRSLIAEIAIDVGIDKIVRINTDNITFDKAKLTKKDLNILENISPTFIKETKTTGMFNIKHINKFEPL